MIPTTEGTIPLMRSDGQAAKQSEPRRAREGAREPYAPPRLTPLGDVREVTLGGSPGVGDSVNPGTRHP
jgi:hypothetical protein